MYQGDPTLLDGFNSDFDSVTPHLEIEKNRILKVSDRVDLTRGVADQAAVILQDRMRWAIFTIPVPASGDTAPSVAQVIKDSEQATGDHLLPDIAVQEKVFSNFAGIIGLIFANADQGHTCLGPVLIDRAFQVSLAYILALDHAWYGNPFSLPMYQDPKAVTISRMIHTLGRDAPAWGSFSEWRIH